MSEYVTDYDNDLVPSWNRAKPKFMGFLHAIINPLEESAGMISVLPLQYDLQVASGDMLDQMGHMVGASRTLPFLIEGYSRDLDDDAYRMMIKARIAQSSWDGTMQGLEQVLRSVFSDYDMQVFDNQDGSIRVLATVHADLGDMRRELLLSGVLVPRPAGVSVLFETAQSIPVATVQVASGAYCQDSARIVNPIGPGVAFTLNTSALGSGVLL